MKRDFFVVLLLPVLWAEGSNTDAIFSRKKRYVVFPEGSSLSIAICLTSQSIMPHQVWTEGLNWGISYDLPNDTSTFKEFIYPKAVMQRRHRRDLYQKMETIMYSMGFDGRACIFRSLCEVSRRLNPKGSNVMEEILSIVFGYPMQRLLPSEPEEHRIYHWAARMGHDQEDCAKLFPQCSFSLIDMFLSGFSNQNLDDVQFDDE